MRINFLKNKIILIIILSVVFGLGAGIVGELLARVYIFENILNIPFYGEINLTNDNHGNANFIIRDAKNVIVKQDEKINETVKNIRNNMVGIFKESKEAGNDNLYHVSEEIAQGIVLTSDGWIIVDLNGVKINNDNLDDFFAVDREGDVYQADKILNDQYSSYSFLHLKEAKSLLVTQFAAKSGIIGGLSALVVDWDENNAITSISGKKVQKIFSSDILNDEYLFSLDLSKYKTSPAYDLSGNLLGFVNDEGGLYPIYNLERVIRSVLRDNEIRRVKMGLNYIDLSSYISDSEKLKGIKIVKNSNNISIESGGPAFLANLLEGDIILSVDNIELTAANNLNQIIQNHKKGDTINISFSREGEINTASLILDEY